MLGGCCFLFFIFHGFRNYELLLIHFLKDLENICELSGVTVFYHNIYITDAKEDRCKSIPFTYMPGTILDI